MTEHQIYYLLAVTVVAVGVMWITAVRIAKGT